MAVLYDIQNASVPAGSVLTNVDITPPPGTVAITYQVTVGNPDAPVVEDFTAVVEALVDGVWRRVSEFQFGFSSQSTGRVPVRGTAMRINARSGRPTTVSVLTQTAE